MIIWLAMFFAGTWYILIHPDTKILPDRFTKSAYINKQIGRRKQMPLVNEVFGNIVSFDRINNMDWRMSPTSHWLDVLRFPSDSGGSVALHLPRPGSFRQRRLRKSNTWMPTWLFLPTAAQHFLISWGFAFSVRMPSKSMQWQKWKA